MPVPIYRTYGD